MVPCDPPLPLPPADKRRLGGRLLARTRPPASGPRCPDPVVICFDASFFPPGLADWWIHGRWPAWPNTGDLVLDLYCGYSSRIGITEYLWPTRVHTYATQGMFLEGSTRQVVIVPSEPPRAG